MEQLPLEVVQGVLVAVGDGHLVASACALVCRQWAALASDPALWKALVLRYIAGLPDSGVAPSKEAMQMVGHRWKEAYFALARRTKHATVALMGHERSGKSTLFDLLRHLRSVSGDGSIPDGPHLLAVQDSAERAAIEKSGGERRPTRISQCADLELRASRCHLTLVDLPCDRENVKNFWTGLVGAHCGVLVVSCLDSEFITDIGAAARQHPMAGVIAGIKHLVVAINKIDTREAQWRQSSERMDEIMAQMSRWMRIAGVRDTAVQYVPISAVRGTNIVRRDHTELPWYSGPTLLSALQHTVESVPSVNSPRLRWNLSAARPLRLCVRKVYHHRTVHRKNTRPDLRPDQALVVGTIMSGLLCVGDKLVVAPIGMEAVEVEGIERNRQPLHVAYGPCERVGLLVRFDRQRSFPGLSPMSSSSLPWYQKTLLRRGVVMGRTGELDPANRVASFEAKVVLVHLAGEIRNGYVSTIRCHSAAVACRWQLLSKVGRSSGAEESPQSMRRGDTGIVRLTPVQPVYLEPYCPEGHLGRFVNYENRVITAFGTVQKVEWSEPHTPVLVTKQQAAPNVGTLTVRVLDGYIESGCPWTPDQAIVRLGLTQGRQGPRTASRATSAQCGTCNPNWRETFTFTGVNANRTWLYVAMEDTGSGREYGEETYMSLSGLVGAGSLRRRVAMRNIYNLNNYVNVRLEFGPPEAHDSA